MTSIVSPVSGTVFDQFLEVIAVEGILDDLSKPCPDLGPIPVANRLQEQLPKRAIVEGEPAQDVEHLAAQCPAFFVQLLQKPLVHLALAGFLRHQIPQVADFGLADAVNTPEPLFQAVGFQGRS